MTKVGYRLARLGQGVSVARQGEQPEIGDPQLLHIITADHVHFVNSLYLTATANPFPSSVSYIDDAIGPKQEWLTYARY